ncbi:1-acylglycerol-3-phosphate O-acyltransferase [Gottschalkia purinilytica]|uniref:1-acyl-sn-glycerol-3-phosphate acyltransferase n=1 Tax=Gottschalkia purinilytica TaxID=1503 RepID=A0A0L0W7K6_GOTPU|nr:lysophospholipid acyltransferase family protein [Gottschalkia purinilytica]KNF07446.1 1-acylglycerol-3-phosphate O-acyltransferase [Gottschalkia purinilytica]
MIFYNLVKNLSKIMFKLGYKLKIIGIENIPKNGKVIICSNHVNLLDPILIAAISPRQLHFMAKKELFKNKFLKIIFNGLGAFPVDREGADLSAIRNSLKILKEDKVFALFPEGTRMTEMNLDSVKPGVAMISIKSKSPIVPVYIDTNYKPFTKLKVIIGKPISFEDYYDKKLSTDDYRELSKRVLKEIYKYKDR